MGDGKLLQEIGARIHDRRRELHMTQETLAEKMEVSVQMISNLELGKKAVRPENLVKVCRELRISADYILTGRHPEWAESEIGQSLAELGEQDRKLVELLIHSLAEKNK